MPTPTTLHVLLQWECTFAPLIDISRLTRAGAGAVACEAAEAGEFGLSAAGGAGAGADHDEEDCVPGIKRVRGSDAVPVSHEHAAELTALVVEWCGKQGVERAVLVPGGGMMLALRSPARPRDVGRCIARLISRAGIAAPAVSFAAGYDSWYAAMKAADSRNWIGDAAAAPPAFTLGVCASFLAHTGPFASVGCPFDIARLRMLCVEGSHTDTERAWMPDKVWLASDNSVVTHGRVFETTRVATHERQLTVPGLWATEAHFVHYAAGTSCVRSEWAIGFAGDAAGAPVRWQVVTAGAHTQLPGPGDVWTAGATCGPLVTGRTPVAARSSTAATTTAAAVATRLGEDVTELCWTSALPALIAAPVHAVDAGAGGDLHTEDGRCWRFVTAEEARAMPPWSATLWGYRACSYASRSLDAGIFHDKMLAMALMDKETEVTLLPVMFVRPLPDIGLDPYDDRVD